MFMNLFIGRFKMNLRNKSNLMWSLVFSLSLGTLFYAAFHSIYDRAKSMPVPVALVEGDSFTGSLIQGDWMEKLVMADGIFDQNKKDAEKEDSSMAEMLNELTYDDGTRMLKARAVRMDEAEKLLEEEQVDGIIDMRDLSDIKLTVAGSGINQSILTSVVSVFRQYSQLIRKTIQKNPARITMVLDRMEEEISLVDAEPLSGENKDPYVAYFYNLIAMMCLMASMAGLEIPVSCQANLSDVGARVNVSPISKGLYEVAGLLATLLTQTVITMIGLVYLIYGLKIHFGENTAQIFLTAALGTVLGASLGFFIGHIGSISGKAKDNILMAVIIGGGFLSGLMYANMKIEIEKSFPLLNRINPSAVITDAFYSLNMFGISGRFYRSITYMTVLIIVFIVGGLLLSGRKSYESL